MKQTTKTRLDRLEHLDAGAPRLFVVVRDIQDAETKPAAGYRPDVDSLLEIVGLDPDREP